MQSEVIGMKDVILSSYSEEETRRSMLILKQGGKNKCKNMVAIISETMGLFLLSQIITCIGIVIYLFSGLMSKMKKDLSDGFEFEFTFNTGDGLAYSNQVSNLVLIMLFTEIFMILIFILYAKLKDKMSLSSMGFVKTNMASSYLKGVLGAAICMMISALICLVTGAAAFKNSDFSGLYMLLFLLGWIIQGLAEETMCRGFLMTSIARCYSLKTAVIANSMVFAVLHVLNPSGITILALVNLFLYGVFASMMFIYSENIWLCAGFHTVWNMIQGNVFGIPVSGIRVASVFEFSPNKKLSLINGGCFGLEGGLCVTVILVISLLILFSLCRKKKVIND